MSALTEAKARLLLPEAMNQLGFSDHVKKSSKCPFHADQTNSFSVYERNGEWFWKCHAGCGGGGVIEFLAKLDGSTNEDACKKLIVLARTQPAARSSRPIKSRAVSAPQTIEPIPAMPDSVCQEWKEGVEHVLADPSMVSRLATFRGWPDEKARYVIECGTISMPLYNGERGLAFQVMVPEGRPGSMITRPVGYHVRLKKPSMKKATWRFQPNESEHGHGIPALPYILGDFEQARLLVVVEGQWDALTFAIAAGWLDYDSLWPSGVGIIGIRSAAGVGAFLKYYRPFWPHGVNCLVLPDGDEAGRRWHEGEHCFAQQLAELGANVSVVNCGPWKDFNDCYRAEKPGRDQIYELLADHGLPGGRASIALSVVGAIDEIDENEVAV